MLSLFSIVGLALYAETITSLPTLPSSSDAELSAQLGLDLNQFSTVGTNTGALFPSLDTSSSDDAEALLSQQLALNVGSLDSAPPLASQNYVDPGCDKGPKGKRDTGGADTFCPAYFTNPNPTPSGAAQERPQKNPEGQQQQNPPAPQKPNNATPRKPGSRGDLQLTPSDLIQNPFGEKDKDPQCPRQYKYTVCGMTEPRYSTLAAPLTIYDADLVINSGFGFGMVVRPAWKGRGGIAGWTDALEECGPDPRKIYCCNIYLLESRQAYSCEVLDSALKSERCWKGVTGMPTQTVLNCIENL